MRLVVTEKEIAMADAAGNDTNIIERGDLIFVVGRFRGLKTNGFGIILLFLNKKEYLFSYEKENH